MCDVVHRSRGIFVDVLCMAQTDARAGGLDVGKGEAKHDVHVGLDCSVVAKEASNEVCHWWGARATAPRFSCHCEERSDPRAKPEGMRDNLDRSALT